MVSNSKGRKMSKESEKFEESKCETSIYHLPPNILLTIFQYLDLKSLCKSSRVCRAWHNYANDPSLWRTLDLRPYQMNLRTMWKIVNRRVSECTKVLQIKGTVTATKKLENISNPLLEEIKKTATNLESLFLINCYLKNVTIESVSSNITSLSLAESLVPLAWFQALNDKNILPSLEYLDLTACTRISREDISSICKLTTLKTLILSGCYRIKDEDVRDISINLKNLTKLDLCDCKKIKDVSLHHIARHLKDIEWLSFANCRCITMLGITSLKDGCLNKLVFLDILGCCHQIQAASFNLFANNEELTLKTCELDSGATGSMV